MFRKVGVQLGGRARCASVTTMQQRTPQRIHSARHAAPQSLFGCSTPVIMITVAVWVLLSLFPLVTVMYGIKAASYANRLQHLEVDELDTFVGELIEKVRGVKRRCECDEA